MKIAVCQKCEEILAAGDFNHKIPPTHAVKGKVHTAKIVTLDDDPMGSAESPADYFKRLKKSHKTELFS